MTDKMVHYALSILLIRVVLATSTRTFDECISYCVEWNVTSDNYSYHCENISVSTCFDELTRDVPINALAKLNVQEYKKRRGSTPVEIHYPIIHNATHNVNNATHYLLKYSVYDPISNFTPNTAYEIRRAQGVVVERACCGVDPYPYEPAEKYFKFLLVPRCKEMNATVWPVISHRLGKPASFHFKPAVFQCQIDNKSHLCDTESINSANVVFHDAEPTCNTDKQDWQVRFDINDIGGDDVYRVGSIPRCKILRSISINVCESRIGCYGVCNDYEKNYEYIKSRSAYFSKLSESESSECDPSNRFCTFKGSLNDPNENRFEMPTETSNYQSLTRYFSCKPTYSYNITVARNSATILKNMKLIMPKLNYNFVYELTLVLGFAIDDKGSSFPNTDIQGIVPGYTYSYYVRTYSDQHECKANKQSNYVIYIVIGTVILLILVLIATSTVIHRRSRKKHSKKRRFNGSMELLEERYHDMIRCPSDDDIFEIDSQRVLIFKDQVLGQGAFGKVYKGKIKGLARTSFHATSKLTDDQELAENMLVAVKQCYEFADATTKREFLREIQVMKELYQHDSLVNILHCITQYPHKPFSLIVEYCEHGDLLKFLQNSKVYLEKLQTDELDNERIIMFDDVAQITFEVADGMAYLAEKGYIHRDIAARNIMVTKGKHVKIGDFGLCRSVVSQDDVYTTKGGRLPIKWMAIESLYDYQFSTKSDVWSYGVLLYEVTTLGLQPYADVVPQDGDFRRAMIAHLRSGARLEQPLSCPDEIYAIMTRTWAEKPEDRACFAEIRETARRLVESLHDLDGGVYGDRYVAVEVNRCDQSDGEECV